MRFKDFVNTPNCFYQIFAVGTNITNAAINYPTLLSEEKKSEAIQGGFYFTGGEA
jgi:hypothetical protein